MRIPAIVAPHKTLQMFLAEENRNEIRFEILGGRLDHVEDALAAIEYAVANRAEISSGIRLDLETRRRFFPDALSSLFLPVASRRFSVVSFESAREA